jgi:hypothetical protein
LMNNILECTDRRREAAAKRGDLCLEANFCCEGRSAMTVVDTGTGSDLLLRKDARFGSAARAAENLAHEDCHETRE